MRSFRDLDGVQDFPALFFLLAAHLKSCLKSFCKTIMAKQQLQQGHQQHPQQNPGLEQSGKPPPSPVETWSSCGGEMDSTVVSDLHGTLLRSRNPFPYFFLVAFEAGGGFPRALILLAFYPLIAFLHGFVSQHLALRFLVFISLAGVKESALKSVARAVLPKFLLEDMHPESYKVFTSCGKRYVITSTPTAMVEPFLKEFLGVEHVMGTELQVSSSGRITGLLRDSDMLIGTNKERALRGYFRDRIPEIGLGSSGNTLSGNSFLSLCQDAFLVSSSKQVPPVSRKDYLKPLVFHDGRFAVRPTPLMALVVFLWLPFGFFLAIPRVLVAVLAPSVPLAGFLEAILGLKIRMKGIPPPSAKVNGHGVLFVCTHRMLVDPLFLSVCVSRRVTAVTYSISRISEVLAPIKTMRLTRCRAQDARSIRSLLEQGDLAVCPEGTTCREPYLLRFSSLFAELTDLIVPVAVTVKFQMFHGSTARGWKALDPLFFLLNPLPEYQIEFLEQVPHEFTCASGKSSFEVADYVQEKLAQALGYECTRYTRKDKYRILAGNDGFVKETTQPKRLLQW